MAIINQIKQMQFFSSMLLSVAFGSTVAASTMDNQDFNPVNINLLDCVTGLRNGYLVDQQTRKPVMSAQYQDYADGQYWTVGEYIRSR